MPREKARAQHLSRISHGKLKASSAGNSLLCFSAALARQLQLEEGYMEDEIAADLLSYSIRSIAINSFVAPAAAQPNRLPINNCYNLRG